MEIGREQSAVRRERVQTGRLNPQPGSNCEREEPGVQETKNTAMKIQRLLLAGVLFGAQPVVEGVAADDANTLALIRQLQKRIDDLEQKVRVLEAGKAADRMGEAKSSPRLEDSGAKGLERDVELKADAAELPAKEMPRLSVGENGFAFGSTNGDFLVQLKGVLQVDMRTFFNDGGTVGNDGILLRRARPALQGTVFRDFDFLFVPDFGGTSPAIFDAYVNYTYSPALQLQAGKFKTPVGLEQLQADRDILLNERGLSTDLVPNRDLGFELHGNLFDGRVSYAAGIFDGVGDAQNNSANKDFEDDKSFAGRLFFQPFKTMRAPGLQGMGFGVGGSYESMQRTNTAGLPSTTGGILPGYASVGQQQFFAYNPSDKSVIFAAGEHWRLAPQSSYYFGPFGLMGEYVISEQKLTRSGTSPQPAARLNNTAWDITVSWVLTGEAAAYAGGVLPRRPFNPHRGDWGAVQLVARYGELKLDRAAFPNFADAATSARSAGAWSVGLNWYLNQNVKLSTSFSRTSFEGGGSGAGGAGGLNRPDENVLFTRLQLAF
jgi:phosphate-selective porin OprO/OprP